MKCAICGKDAGFWGNNPDPVLPISRDGKTQVCDHCNSTVVIPARLGCKFEITTYKGEVVKVNEKE